jgi:hypothetical protein
MWRAIQPKDIHSRYKQTNEWTRLESLANSIFVESTTKTLPSCEQLHSQYLCSVARSGLLKSSGISRERGLFRAEPPTVLLLRSSSLERLGRREGAVRTAIVDLVVVLVPVLGGAAPVVDPVDLLPVPEEAAVAAGVAVDWSIGRTYLVTFG